MMLYIFIGPKLIYRTTDSKPLPKPVQMIPGYDITIFELMIIIMIFMIISY